MGQQAYHQTFSESAPTHRRSSTTFKHEIIEFPIGGTSLLRERDRFCANSLFSRAVIFLEQTAVPLVRESYYFMFKSSRAATSGSGTLKKGLLIASHSYTDYICTASGGGAKIQCTGLQWGTFFADPSPHTFIFFISPPSPSGSQMEQSSLSEGSTLVVPEI